MVDLKDSADQILELFNHNNLDWTYARYELIKYLENMYDEFVWEEKAQLEDEIDEKLQDEYDRGFKDGDLSGYQDCLTEYDL